MLRLRLILVAALLPGQTVAQTSTSSSPQVVEVALSSFAFTPRAIRLRAGQPITLRLINTSGGGHNFSSPEFFAAAQVRQEDAAAVAGGTVEVPKRGRREVTLVPKAGRYRLKCTHAFHTTFGMKGEIVVA